MAGASIPIIKGIAALSQDRKAWLCDVWGVLHDGVTKFAPAIDACRAFRRQGGEIVLISNSPRPAAGVIEHLTSAGVPGDCYDALVTSGDVTRGFLENYRDETVFHLGPERDKSFFDGLKVAFAAPDQASVVVCTGFIDEDRETPEDYDGLLASLAARAVPMICANPDLYVERGAKLLPCAGLLAQRYSGLGQTVLQAGKPYAPIYERAMQKLSNPVLRRDLLAIGDGVDTDILGASKQGIEAIYIASRVHLPDVSQGRYDSQERIIDEALLTRIFAGRPFRPCAAMIELAW